MKTRIWAKVIAVSGVLTILNSTALAQGRLNDPPVAGGAEAASQPATQPSTAALEERIRNLEEHQNWLESSIKTDKEVVAAKAAKAAIVGAGSEGFFVKSANDDFKLKVGGYVQADGRFVNGQESTTSNDTFLLRRARPIFEGTVWKYVDYKLMLDFGNGQTALQDAYGELKYFPQAKLRVGKYKQPFGLERLQSDQDTRLIELATSSNLTPNRDVGAMLNGDLAGGFVNYAVGIFNGVADAGSGDRDTDGGKDLAARAFFTPFKNSDSEALKGFGAGAAVTYGVQDGTADANGLPTYKTFAQETFFKFRSDALAEGSHTRVSPQAYYYYKSFGVMGEWIQSAQEVSRTTNQANIVNSGWQVQAAYALTGEKESYKGIDPLKPFTLHEGGGWGAWELAGRVSQLSVDSDAFPTYADPAKYADSATEAVVGLNWYPNKNTKLMFDYARTNFDGGAPAGGDRETEDAFLVRFQVSF